jgi:hypothetical protein
MKKYGLDEGAYSEPALSVVEGRVVKDRGQESLLLAEYVHVW